MAILPFKEGYYGIIWARHSCFSLTHLRRCVSDYACLRVCVNNTLPSLPLIGLPWCVTLPQPIVIIYVIVSCPLTKEEQEKEEEVWWKNSFNYSNAPPAQRLRRYNDGKSNQFDYSVVKMLSVNPLFIKPLFPSLHQTLKALSVGHLHKTCFRRTVVNWGNGMLLRSAFPTSGHSKGTRSPSHAHIHTPTAVLKMQRNSQVVGSG